MTKFILLEFEDVEDADVFLENLKSAEGVFTLDEDSLGGVSNDYRSHHPIVRSSWQPLEK